MTETKFNSILHTTSRPSVVMEKGEGMYLWELILTEKIS